MICKSTKRYHISESCSAVCSLIFFSFMFCFSSPAFGLVEVFDDVQPDDPTTWDQDTTAYIGKDSDGTMNITNGSDILSRVGYIGYSATSTGEVTVNGEGSTWTFNWDDPPANLDDPSVLYIGYSGNGTLNISGGGIVEDFYGCIGKLSGSRGRGVVKVDGANSEWKNGSTLAVGSAGYGSLEITNGGKVSSGDIYVGSYYSSVGEVTVDGDGSTLSNLGEFRCGEYGSGTLNIKNGGVVNLVGFDGGSKSEVVIDGSGSNWIGVISASGGIFNIKNGSEVNAWAGFLSDSCEVTVDGPGSKWMNIYDLEVDSTSSLTITRGGFVSVGYDVWGMVINENGFVNMSTGGMLALLGNADDSLDSFLGLIDGDGAIQYWDNSVSGWADISGATNGEDYTLSYMSDGDWSGYTILTVGVVPEPATLAMLAAVLASLMARTFLLSQRKGSV